MTEYNTDAVFPLPNLERIYVCCHSRSMLQQMKNHSRFHTSGEGVIVCQWALDIVELLVGFGSWVTYVGDGCASVCVEDDVCLITSTPTPTPIAIATRVTRAAKTVKMTFLDRPQAREIELVPTVSLTAISLSLRFR